MKIYLIIALSLTVSPSFASTDVKYTTHGNGEKKVIVLHSWMDDSESWSPMIKHLDVLHHTYVFVDLRGYGKSKEIKGQYTSDEIANDVFELADALHWNEFYLIGHSMSGMAVQKAALLDTSNRIKKVIAITPVSSAGFPVDAQNMQFFKAIVQNEEVANKAFRTFTSNRLSNTWYSSRSKRHVEVTDEQAQLAYIEMWSGENFSARMKTVKTPFLVLSGQYDHPGFKLDRQQKAFAHIENVSYVHIENSGHFPMQETPIFLAAKIEEFINE